MVFICTPVFNSTAEANVVRNEAGVIEKFGVKPKSIPHRNQREPRAIWPSRQYFFKPVVDTRIPITRSGNFAVLIRPLLVSEVDHGLRAAQRIVEFLCLTGEKLFALRGGNEHGALDASCNFHEIVFLHGTKGVVV